MELVQNADDNNYPAGEMPYIQFLLRHKHLIVSNNELGFEEANVRAICAVDQSTKKRKAGFIGEKGIGFKSVFVWCDEPHVLSNGYDFKFRHGHISGQELGFLVPYFPCRQAWPVHDLQFCEPAKTKFYLPFRAEGEHSVANAARELSKQFKSDMQPETVLFLRKLNEIRLFYPGDKDYQTIRVSYRRTIAENGVDVSVTQETQKHDHDGTAVYVLTESKRVTHHYRKGVHTIDVPPGPRAEPRRNYPSTQILIAFPLHSDGLPDVDRVNNVFAFLPIRSFGFKFVIQADFLLVANREDIMKENVWNIWLRDSLPEAFMKIFPAVFANDPRRKLQFTWIRYLPKAQEIHDPFF
eukprot:CAMPEP_0174708020 /NCGR_PEP_ID=MMETSP1094-20130205/10379_1 /TAXON_ID=156173 /ORGANISM="Chrysochromulina brevifilum, Strain UTEX LB 985" /LENGTH=352 /DNA_ID=CAMNT_0015906507 /DNA_START=66 /DNA_END=1121 /DNA_ORIENTATION=-